MKITVLRSSIEAKDLKDFNYYDVTIIDDSVVSPVTIDDITASRHPKAVGWDEKFCISPVSKKIEIGKVQMIKMVRALTGWDLRESKDWVDALCS